jgi:hypothetical protein
VRTPTSLRTLEAWTHIPRLYWRSPRTAGHRLHGARVAGFCDGEFWHGKDLSKRLARLASGHTAVYWVARVGSSRRHLEGLANVSGNAARDRQVDEALSLAAEPTSGSGKAKSSATHKLGTVSDSADCASQESTLIRASGVDSRSGSTALPSSRMSTVIAFEMRELRGHVQDGLRPRQWCSPLRKQSRSTRE